MKREQFIDFFHVSERHQAIHKRLENWAQACYSPGSSAASPMFRLYQPDNFERQSTRIPVDTKDAAKIAKGVAALPTPHRLALNWNYLEGGSPRKARERIGVTTEHLMQLIVDGRDMLINRGV